MGSVRNVASVTGVQSAPDTPRWRLPRRTGSLILDTVNGILLSFISVFFAVTYAALIFAHAPATSLAVGVGVLLIGTFVMNAVASSVACRQRAAVDSATTQVDS